MNKSLLLILLLILTLFSTACIRREITVDSDPQGALVYLNDKEVGRTPVTVPFTWHGDYDIRLEREGYETHQSLLVTKMEAYEYPPFDLVVTVLPVDMRNHQYFKFKLRKKNNDVNVDKLIERAKELESRLEGPDETESVEPTTSPSTQPKDE